MPKVRVLASNILWCLYVAYQKGVSDIHKKLPDLRHMRELQTNIEATPPARAVKAAKLSRIGAKNKVHTTRMAMHLIIYSIKLELLIFLFVLAVCDSVSCRSSDEQ